MGKELSKRKKKLKQDPHGLARMLQDPRFVCEKCGRSARKKKYLCRARKMAATAWQHVA